jgi:hypothetical protein
MNQRLLSLLAVSAIVACGAVQAAEVGVLTNATTFDFGTSNYQGTSAQTIAPGITWTAESGASLFGYNGGYGFANNGGWYDGSLNMIGTNTSTSAMRISFASPVSGVGMFMNYAPGYGTPLVQVFDSHNVLLDSYTPTFTFTSGASNAGQFIGFTEGSADIAYMTMSGAYIGGAHLEVSAVPESSNLALMAAGLGCLGGVARRLKKE